MKIIQKLISAALLLTGLFATTGTLQADGQPLKICATVPELGMLASEIGGNRVTVETFARGTEDPHFVDAKPGYIRSLSQADLYLQVGMELEIGWAPALLKQARNQKVLPGQSGFLDASTAISPLDVPKTDINRGMGDVHPMGSPHFLTDPSAGILVAALIRDRLKNLDPAYAAYYDARYRQFEKSLCVKIFGASITDRYANNLHQLALLLHKSGYEGFLAFLKKNGLQSKLGGWMAQMQRLQSNRYVGDHKATWSYLGHVFGLKFTGYMEDTPGVDPSTSHLTELAARMQSEHAKFILSAAYYSPKYARFLAEKTGAGIIPMANQGDARPGTDTYMKFLEYNIHALLNGGQG